MRARPHIRPLRADDLERVAELFVTTFRADGSASTASVAEYMRTVYLDGPSSDPDLPSLVAENAQGDVGAFVGVTRAFFTKGNRRLRAAIPGNLMVEPGSNPLIASRLISAFLAGGQDFSFADTATDVAARIWKYAGGIRCPAYSLTFTRALRPAAHAAYRFARRNRRPGAAAAARFAARPLDFALERLPLEPLGLPRSASSVVDLDLKTVAPSMGKVSALSLYPSYEDAWLDFVLEQAAQRGKGRLLGRAVEGEGRGSAPAGWFLYYPNPGSVAEVLQLVARPRSFGKVFEALVTDAYDEGAVAVSGRAHPSQLRALGKYRCSLVCEMWTVVHSRRAEVEQAFLRGEALPTALEGEGWMRFIGDSFEE